MLGWVCIALIIVGLSLIGTAVWRSSELDRSRGNFEGAAGVFCLFVVALIVIANSIYQLL